MGVLYILDEPSHRAPPRGTTGSCSIRCIRLRDLGNTVLVVEHDQETMEAADYLVDLGPGRRDARRRQLVADGTPAEVDGGIPTSLTGRYLSGDARDPGARPSAAPANGEALEVIGAREQQPEGHRRARFPLGTFICVTGVSGSGKSTLVNDILYRALARAAPRHAADAPGAPRARSRASSTIDKVIDIDQSPIGRTPRSNPATYTGALHLIRDLFAQLPEAKVRGYAPGRFSFNVKGGRCEACGGDGVVKIEMHFLPDVYVTLRGLPGEALQPGDARGAVQGARTIADVLELTVDEALELPATPSRRSAGSCEIARRTSGSATSTSASRRRRSPAARRSG